MARSTGFSVFYGSIPGEEPEARIECAAVLGFEAFEIGLEILRPAEGRLLEALQARRFSVSTIIVDLNDVNTGRATSQNAWGDIDAALELSIGLGRPRVVVVDYFPEGAPAGLLDVGRRRAILEELLQSALPRAEAEGLVLLIEPMAAQSHSTFPDVDSAVAFIDRMGSPSVRMLYDTYHLAWDGHDPLAVLKRHVEIIGHIHLSDAAPGHPQEPRPLPGAGAGQVDFAPIVRFLMGRPEFTYWALEGGPANVETLSTSLRYLRTLMTQEPTSTKRIPV